MKQLIEEFKAFILRGNVIQLAVAVVMGVAFGEVVKSVQTDLISPILGAIGGKPDFSYIHIGAIRIGSFINALIAFSMTAAAVFFLIIKPINKLMALTEKPKDPNAPTPPPPATLDDVVAALKELKK
ncbi:MAG: large conductance mechanosensitive channel protein MscL [Verrucomicrobiota bacterium]